MELSICSAGRIFATSRQKSSQAHQELTISTAFYYLHLANARDALYNGMGNAVVRNTAGAYGTHIGNEWEGTGAYPFTKYLTSA